MIDFGRAVSRKWWKGDHRRTFFLGLAAAAGLFFGTIGMQTVVSAQVLHHRASAAFGTSNKERGRGLPSNPRDLEREKFGRMNPVYQQGAAYGQPAGGYLPQPPPPTGMPPNQPFYGGQPGGAPPGGAWKLSNAFEGPKMTIDLQVFLINICGNPLRNP